MAFDPYKRESAKSQRAIDAHVRDVTTDPFKEKKKRAKRAAATKRAGAKGKRR
jgi:hypothetical protein